MNRLMLPEPVKIYARRQLILAFAVATVMVSFAIVAILTTAFYQ